MTCLGLAALVMALVGIVLVKQGSAVEEAPAVATKPGAGPRVLPGLDASALIASHRRATGLRDVAEIRREGRWQQGDTLYHYQSLFIPGERWEETLLSDDLLVRGETDGQTAWSQRGQPGRATSAEVTHQEAGQHLFRQMTLQGGLWLDTPWLEAARRVEDQRLDGRALPVVRLDLPNGQWADFLLEPDSSLLAAIRMRDPGDPLRVLEETRFCEYRLFGTAMLPTDITQWAGEHLMHRLEVRDAQVDPRVPMAAR